MLHFFPALFSRATSVSIQDGIEPMQVEDDPAEYDSSSEPQSLEQNFIVENAPLDLEEYCASYSDVMKTERLLFIARHAPSLKLEACKLALAHVRLSFNVEKYKEIHLTLSESVSEPLLPYRMEESSLEIPPFDLQWVEETKNKADLLLYNLDLELKDFKRKSIRINIRRGFDSLAKHYHKLGDLSNAHRMFFLAKNYCSTPEQTTDTYMNLIQESIYLGRWMQVSSYVNKVLATGNFSCPDKEGFDHVRCSKLRCAAGIAALADGKYRHAATNFLRISFQHCDFPEFLSTTDVAVYGSLCALATFSRSELCNEVIFSSSFRNFLELHHQISEIVTAFYNSKYTHMLSLLQEIRDILKLDLFLSQHVETLFSLIRSKSLVQYCTPYVVTDIRKMAKAFNSTMEDIESELEQLISNQDIQARIDSEAKILYARDVDPKTATFQKVLYVGEKCVREGKAALLRAAVLRNNISVQIPEAIPRVEPKVSNKEHKSFFKGW